MYKISWTNKTKEKKYLNLLAIVNKPLELIQLPFIFKLPEVVFQLSDKLKNYGNSHAVTYQLSKTIRNKILKVKEAVNYLYGDKDVSLS